MQDNRRRCNSTTANRAVNFLLDCTNTQDLRQGLHKAKEVFLKHITDPEERDQVEFACVSVNRALKIIEKGGHAPANQFVSKGGELC